MRLARQVDVERGGPAIFRFTRNPALALEAALGAFLADPPEPLHYIDDGSGFLRAPYAPNVGQLDEVTVAEARVSLRTTLAHDLAYDSRLMSLEHADELTAAILAFAEGECRWWTNSRIGRHDQQERHVCSPVGNRSPKPLSTPV